MALGLGDKYNSAWAFKRGVNTRMQQLIPDTPSRRRSEFWRNFWFGPKQSNSQGGVFKIFRTTWKTLQTRAVKRWTGTQWTVVEYQRLMVFLNDAFSWVYTREVEVGDTYLGGIVGYVYVNGDPGYVAGQTHGIIAAAVDQSADCEWGCTGTDITGAEGTSLGTGAQNTEDILAECSTVGIAAEICYNLTLSGYTDWFLPSKDELNKLYVNRLTIGNFASDRYWSSSENTASASLQAYSQSFSTGTSTAESKNVLNRCRAIKYF